MHLFDQLYIEPDFREKEVEEIHDIIDDALEDFKAHAKRDFSSPTDSLEVSIGGRNMDYPRIQVTKGVMNIEACVYHFFGVEPLDGVSVLSRSRADEFFNGYVEQAVEEIARRVERHQLTVYLPLHPPERCD